MDSRPVEAVGDDSAEFTAKPQDIGTDEIYDDAPKTSDSSQLYGYIALAIILFISIIGEGIIMIRYSRKNK